MKAYYRYSESERAALDDAQLNDAIRIEAIERGMVPPITLPESLQKQEFVGYKVPAKSVPVYIACSNEHDEGAAYLDESKAIAALDGIIHIESSGYTINKVWMSRKVIGRGNKPFVKKIWITKENEWQNVPDVTIYAPEEEVAQKFKELADQCLEDYRKIRQEIYNQKVRVEKKKEYLRLSNGDEEIAKAFWNKVEDTHWPA